MTPSQVIEALKQALPAGKFVERGTELFEELNTSYLSTLESDIQPAYIFQPRNRKEVAIFLRAIKPFIESVKFAIRGAGCQPVPGCANIQDGITLDLNLLTGIDIKDGSVQIGAGERWGTVYQKLDGEELGVCGSRSAKGGIGGLALEGRGAVFLPSSNFLLTQERGLSFFSSREGFICDNVLNYEIVLASGEICNANAQENADLWLALRGGGNNLGVVTSFDCKTFK